WINTIAGKNSESYINELPAISNVSNFEVSWDYISFNDFSPLPIAYTVYVAVNDGPYEPWINSTTEQSAIFRGEKGNTYYFFSSAEFEDGSIEATPEIEDARTTVADDAGTGINSGKMKPELKVYPNPSTGNLTVEYSLVAEGQYVVEIFDLAGKKLYTMDEGIKTMGTRIIRLDNTEFLEKGVYFIRISNEGLSNTMKWVKN
ncbi:MAG: T9SS type A sorting domain-containing protein, partial [Bacteroidales bacterium]